jgi:hypothetical protein
MGPDDRRIYDLVVRRFLAIFHPDAEFENTRVETTVSEHVFRTRGKVLIVPGWRGVYGELADGAKSAAEEDEGRDQTLPKLELEEEVDTAEVEALGYALDTARTGGDHLRAELRGQPCFTGLCGPQWGGLNESGGPIVRYETWEAYKFYSR